MYKVYVLYAPKHDKLFTGMTNSMVDSIRQHNSENPEEWTSVYKPWTLVHMELYNDQSQAASRESFFESSYGESYVKENILPLFKF